MPSGATWNYTEEGLFFAEEFEAVRDGKPLPKEDAAESQKRLPRSPAGAASALLKPPRLLRPGARLDEWAARPLLVLEVGCVRCPRVSVVRRR